jgi:eukaryotic-like serine/threonine-protein kinase
MGQTESTVDGDRNAAEFGRIVEVCDRFEAQWRRGQRPRIEEYFQRNPSISMPALLRELLALEIELARAEGGAPTADEYRARFPDCTELVETVFAAAASRPAGSRPRSSRLRVATGRNLLFGMLALQNNFIGRDDLLTAFAAWIADKAQSLAELLVARGALDDARRALLEALVAEHLKQHGGDPEASLAAVSSLGSVRDDLERLDDADLQASLAGAASRPAGPGGDAGATAAYAPSSRRAGARFRILRFHREGGLGRVYVARDEELGREVALKEIRPDMVAEADLRGRFVLEAEINGGLEHPGIVPVYSLGTYGDGRPFYAMRFVEGDSLKEAIESYHKEHPRPEPTAVEFRKLLGRFVDVCEAIAFAHSKGVLHRDLKPHNVMLGRYGETLLIDWGLAKATGRREPVGPNAAGEATLVPPSGSGHAPTLGVLGSPPFMSPEQATGAADSLGPATDVYGLGAILFALLTGKPPVEGGTIDEILDRVRRGAIRLPRSLNPNIPRALEAVCLKALAPQPADRYPTAMALAEEVEHWLADEPVMAWHEPLSLRARRWARRNRTTATAAAVALLAGVVGLSALAAVQSKANRDLKKEKDNTTRALIAETKAKINTQEALTQKGEALAQSEESRQRAEAVLRFLKNDVLAAARPEGQDGGLGNELTVRKAVDAAEPKIAGAFKDQPAIEADVRDTLGTTYWYLSETPLAIRQHERALDLRLRKLGPDHLDTLQSRNNLAADYLAAGRTAEAIKLNEATLKMRESRLGPDHPDTLQSRMNLAADYHAAGRIAEAIKLDEATLKMCESKLGPDHPDTLSSRNSLANTYYHAGRTGEAVELFLATLKLRESKLGPDHPDTLSSRNNLATSYLATGHTAEAIKLHEATLKMRESKLGPDHSLTVQSRNNLAVDYLAAGRTADAIKLHEATLKVRASKLGPDHPDTLVNRNNLAQAYLAAGRTAEAIKLHEATLMLCESKLGPDHAYTLASRNNLANVYESLGRTAEAIKLHEATLRMCESKLGPDHPNTLVSRNNLAKAYYAVGRITEAIPLHEATLKMREAKLGPDHPNTLNSRNNLAADYFAAGRTAEAIKLHEETLKLRESRLGPDHPNTLNSRNNLATSYRAAGRTAEAIKLYEATLKVRESTLGLDHPDTLISRNNLATGYESLSRWADAEALRRDTLARHRKAEKPDSPLLCGDLAGLGRNLLNQEKWSDAEPLLRECLVIRTQALPDDWSRFNAMSQLGESLLGQGRYAEAEPLIIPGYDGMKAREAKIPATGRPGLVEAAVRVVRLYESWGKPVQATAWKARLGLADLPANVFVQP